MNNNSSKNKIRLSLGLIIVFILYTISVNWKNGKIADTVIAFFRKNESNLSVASSTDKVLMNSVTGKYKDGTYTGSVEDVYYGNVQVRTIISNGNLTSVEFLQYPNGRDNSVKINSRAMPLLKSEAIVSQKAEVDIVTGATQTSKGFIKSLDNALAQATK